MVVCDNATKHSFRSLLTKAMDAQNDNINQENNNEVFENQNIN